jgi:hypothetical protein
MLTRSPSGRSREVWRGFESGVILRGLGDDSGAEPIREIEHELKRGNPATLYDLALGLPKVIRIRPEMRGRLSEAMGSLEPPPAYHRRFKRGL